MLDTIQNLPLTGGLDLQGIVSSNPNITGVRIVEAVTQQTGGPAKLQGILEIGRSILEQRFGRR
jgi:hypothetical protein